MSYISFHLIFIVVIIIIIMYFCIVTAFFLVDVMFVIKSVMCNDRDWIMIELINVNYWSKSVWQPFWVWKQTNQNCRKQ